MAAILIQPCEPSALPVFLGFCRDQGLNPGAADGDLLPRLDAGACFWALLGPQVVGTLAALALDDTLGAIGLGAVAPAFQGSRLEDHLLELGLQRLGTRTIAAICLEAEVDRYAAFGFRPALRQLHYEGVASGQGPAPEGLASPFLRPFEALASLDREALGRDRVAFLGPWLNQAGSLLLGAYEQPQCQGFGLLRPCLHGYGLGPLVAREAESDSSKGATSEPTSRSICAKQHAAARKKFKSRAMRSAASVMAPALAKEESGWRRHTGE